MATFDYFGEKFQFVPADEFPAFEFAEFSELIADQEDENSPRAIGTCLRMAVAIVAEKDRNRFRQVSRKNRAKADDWMKIVWEFMAGESERPTGLPADLSDGQSDTEGNSGSEPVASVTPLTERPEESRPVRADKALAAARSRSA